MREESLLNFLKNKNSSPTIREMKKAIGTSSTDVLYKLLGSLEERGLIKRNKGRWRGVEVLSPEEETLDDDWIRIPLLGTVAAGQPVEAILIPETLSVPRNMLKKGREHFGLRVRGDSMIDANIIDGDLIALQQANTAENGDIVVALIDGENATVKIFKRNGRKIRLEPANRDFDPIEVDADRVTIQGVFAGLVRYGRQ